MQLSRLDPLSRLAGFVALLPALLLVSAGGLHLIFGVAWPSRWLDAALSHWSGRALFSPGAVFGGLVFVGILNLVWVCRFWPSWDEDYVALTVSIRRQGVRLVQLGLACGLLACLLGYAFVENFRVVAR